MKKDSDYCKVTAIVRCELLEKVEHKLMEIGLFGYSVMQVKGCGEYTNFFSHDCMTTHTRIEIFTFVRRAESIAQAIMEAACTGAEGDGIVAVQPVNWVYRIRTHTLLAQENAQP